MLYTEKETYGTSYQEKLWKLKINGAEATHHTREGMVVVDSEREWKGWMSRPTGSLPFAHPVGCLLATPTALHEAIPLTQAPPAAPLEFPMGGVFPTGVAVA